MFESTMPQTCPVHTVKSCPHCDKPTDTQLCYDSCDCNFTKTQAVDKGITIFHFTVSDSGIDKVYGYNYGKTCSGCSNSGVSSISKLPTCSLHNILIHNDNAMTCGEWVSK